MGLIVAVCGLNLSEESEADHEDVQFNQSQSSINTIGSSISQQDRKNTFSYKLKENLHQIGQAMIMPEIYLVILFFMINGMISPDFGDFSYYYMLSVCHMSKF